MNLRVLLALFAGFFVTCVNRPINAEDLTLVPGQSKISFVGTKSDGRHDGGFKKFDVAAIADFEDPSRSSLSVRIDAKSIWADDPKLTNHLKSPDFFNVRKHPAITFESIEVVPGEGEGVATIKGDLYMLGKKVALDVPIKAKVTEEMVEMTAEFTIDRTKWGMNYGQGKVDNEVKITIKFVLKR